MSAEILRRAAEAIRAAQGIKFDQGRIDQVELDTWLAVADWLDEGAVIKDTPDVNASIKIALTDRAIKVARAYLGESA